MKSGIQKSAIIILMGSAFLALTPVVEAQNSVAEKVRARLASALQKLQSECGADLAKFCNTVTPGEGRLIYCVMAHEDKISTKCDYALYNASRNMDRALNLVEQAADVCWPDIEKYCADIPEGGGRIAQCLVAKKAVVGQDCQTALEQFPAVK